MRWMLLLGKVAALSGAIGTLCWGGVSLVREFSARHDALVRVAIRLPQAREAARQAGLLSEEAPLAAPPPDILDEDNAALLYEVIDAELRGRNEGKLPESKDLIAYTFPSRRNDRNRAAARQLLQDHADVLQMATQAAEKPFCAFAIAPDADLSVADNLFWTQYFLLDLTVAQAVLASEEQRPLEALRLLERALHIGRHIGARGDLEGLAGQALGQHFVFRVLTSVLRENEDRVDKMAVGVTRLLDEPAITVSSVRARLAPATALAQRRVQEWRQKPFSTDETEALLEYNRVWRTLYDLDRYLGRQEWTDGTETLMLEYVTGLSRALDTVQASGHMYDAWSTLRDTDIAFRKRYEGVVPQRALPSRMVYTLESVMDADCHRALARATFRLLLAQKNTGVLPESIPGPPIPDPFSPDQGPLRLVRNEEGEPVLYSVGENGTDEGGSRQRAPGRTRGPAEDVCVVFPAPDPVTLLDEFAE